MQISYKFPVVLVAILITLSTFAMVAKEQVGVFCYTASAAEQSTVTNAAASTIAINIKVQDKIFAAELYDNLAAKRLATKLPMSIQMTDLNRNEKKYTMPDRLADTSTEQPSTIYNGDIMCWQGDVLVLFYKTFDNHYGGYTRIGRVHNPEGLAAALGNGTVQVTWLSAK